MLSGFIVFLTMMTKVSDVLGDLYEISVNIQSCVSVKRLQRLRPFIR